jgi:hypothetical protein
LKILFVGHYKEQSGWGVASRKYLKVLDMACRSLGIELVARPIILQGGNTEDFSHLEQIDQIGCTHTIQYLLPNYMVADNRYTNIGFFMWETYNVPKLWEKHIYDMDHVWVTNYQMRESLLNKGIKPSIIQCPFDLSKYVNFDKSKKMEIEELGNSYVFYTIAEANARKNIVATVRAFHAEFGHSENVNLVIKTNRPGVSPSECAEVMISECGKIKNSLNLYEDNKYKSEIIITNHLSEEELLTLHNTCHCYVSSSHGEGINIPMHEAKLMGNTTVGVNMTGEKLVADYVTSSRLGIPFGWESIPGYCNAEDVWVDVDEIALGKNMRTCFEEYKKSGYQNEKITAWSEKSVYGYESVAEHLCGVLSRV